MRIRSLCLQVVLACLLGVVGVRAQGLRPDVELANLHEDVRLLIQKTGELQLRVEQLERENSELRAKSTAAVEAYATVSQLNAAVADMNRVLKASIASSKQETLLQVSQQLEKMGHQMNAALDALSSRASSPPVVASSAPAEPDTRVGIKYVVQKDDTLSSIAKKTGAKVADIMSANKIQNSSKILEGQTLFIPGGK